MKKVLLSIIVILCFSRHRLFWIPYHSNQAPGKYHQQPADHHCQPGSLTATVGATGSVRPDQTAMLTWQTTGDVDQVSVQAGQVITAGQVLASLSQSSLPQTVILAQSDLITAQRQLTDLQHSQNAAQQALLGVNKSQQAVYDAQRAVVRFDQKTYKDDLDRAQERCSG